MKWGRLEALVYPDKSSMGIAAADHVAEKLRSVLAAQDRARVIFGAAPSQTGFLEALAKCQGIEWSRIDAYHLDEYVGVPIGDERSFGFWLDGHIWSRVSPGRVERIDGGDLNGARECARYGALINGDGLDVALVGIGENGHL